MEQGMRALKLRNAQLHANKRVKQPIMMKKAVIFCYYNDYSY